MSLEPSFGEWIRRRRRLLDLTQEELANQVGCSLVTIAKLEANERRPSKQMADRLAKSLVIPADEVARFLTFARSTPLADRLEADLQQDHPAPPLDSLPALPKTRRVDWEEAPDVSNFYGRTDELLQLQRWLLDDRCRLIAVLGIGGIGKTALATKLVHEVQDQFDYVLWRSLRNAPPLEELLEQSLSFFADHILDAPFTSIARQTAALLAHMRRHRCLLILDNAEAILREGERAGQYRSGYESYGQFLQTLGETPHQSCILVTSREKPMELAALEGDDSLVRSFYLASLTAQDGRALLTHKGLSGLPENWLTLIQRYSGNPLALKVVAETIRELFRGSIDSFLREETSIFGGIRDLLTEQFTRLSPLEQEVMVWLAVEREPVGIEELRAEMVQPGSKALLWEALHSLRHRSLLEQAESGFTLQNVVMEYVTEHLIGQVCTEIQTGTFQLFQRHALMKAQTQEYVRESQQRLLLRPVVERLLSTFGRAGIEERLANILSLLRQTQPRSPGYVAANALHLLLHLKSDLRGWDFSQLAVWQAYLSGVALQDVRFRHADLAGSVFNLLVSPIYTVAFHPDGTHFATGADTAIAVWQVKDGRLLFCFFHAEAENYWVLSLCFSPDGTLLASSSGDGSIVLWDVREDQIATFGHGRRLSRLEGHSKQVTSLNYSSSGNLLASGSEDHTVRLWEPHSGECLAILHGHSKPVWSVSFHPDGRMLASSSDDQTIRLWDTDTGECLRVLQGHSAPITSICFSPDGQLLASGSTDNSVRLWDPQMGHALHTLQGHTNRVWSVSFSPDGSLLASCGDDRSVRLWNVATTECLLALHGHATRVRTAKFSPDGRFLVSASGDSTVRLWDARTGRCLDRLQGHQDRWATICFSPDGSLLASSSGSHDVWLWNPSTGHFLNVLKGHLDRVLTLSFDPSGQLLASSGLDFSIRLWNPQTGTCLTTLRGHTGTVWSVSFSPDSRTLASGSSDGSIRLWDVPSGQCIEVLPGHSRWKGYACFSPDGAILATTSDDYQVWLWNMHTRQWFRTLHGHNDRISAICFSDDGSTLATGSYDQSVRLWDVRSNSGEGLCLRILRGHTAWLTSVSFAPSGQLLASSGLDRTVRLWDTTTGECLQILTGHTGNVSSVRFSPDGGTLTTSEDETIRLWDVGNPTDVGECIRILRQERTYERMDVTGATGLTPAQTASLKAFGAVEDIR